MKISDPFVGGLSPGAEVHVHVVINDLEEFSRLGDAARLYLRPDWHVVQTDLEGSRADELSLDCIAQEESHHTGIDFVLQHPGSPARSLHAQERVGVEGGEDHEDQEYLADAEQLCGLKSVIEILNCQKIVWTEVNL